MSKENEKELRKNLELQTKEELIEKIIIQTRTYENALNIITDKNEIIDKALKILGNYKHYCVPDELSNRENEDLVDKAYMVLRGEDNVKD